MPNINFYKHTLPTVILYYCFCRGSVKQYIFEGIVDYVMYDATLGCLQEMSDLKHNSRVEFILLSLIQYKLNTFFET